MDFPSHKIPALDVYGKKSSFSFCSETYLRKNIVYLLKHKYVCAWDSSFDKVEIVWIAIATTIYKLKFWVKYLRSPPDWAFFWDFTNLRKHSSQMIKYWIVLHILVFEIEHILSPSLKVLTLSFSWVLTLWRTTCTWTEHKLTDVTQEAAATDSSAVIARLCHKHKQLLSRSKAISWLLLCDSSSVNTS